MKRRLPECASPHCRNTPPLGATVCGRCSAALEAHETEQDARTEFIGLYYRLHDGDVKRMLGALYTLQTGETL